MLSQTCTDLVLEKTAAMLQVRRPGLKLPGGGAPGSHTKNIPLGNSAANQAAHSAFLESRNRVRKLMGLPPLTE